MLKEIIFMVIAAIAGVAALALCIYDSRDAEIQCQHNHTKAWCFYQLNH